MALSEQFLEEDIHTIDIVEHLAEHNDWDFDRVGDDQIAIIDGADNIIDIFGVPGEDGSGTAHETCSGSRSL